MISLKLVIYSMLTLLAYYIGQKLASRFSSSDNLFSSYLRDSVNESFFFNAVSAYEVQEQISSIPAGNKTYGLYSFPTFLLKLSKAIRDLKHVRRQRDGDSQNKLLQINYCEEELLCIIHCMYI